MSRLIDIKRELESLMPVLQGSTQGASVAFCIRILGERWEVEQQRDRLAEALRKYEAVLADGPENCSWSQYEECHNQARAALAEVDGKGAA